MSRGRQHRSWATKNVDLIGRVKDAHFYHADMTGDTGLTYQSCRFCKSECYRNEDQAHGACWFFKERRRPCKGLWKYNVRHYICSDCRRDILLGLPPAKSRQTDPIDKVGA